MNQNQQNTTSVNDTTDDELKKLKEQEKQNRQNENVAKQQIRQKATSEAKKLAQKGVSKVKDALFDVVGGTVAGTVIAVIIAVLMSIGIISFIFSMPGFVQDKIFDFTMSIGSKISQMINGQNESNTINASDFHAATINALNYLQDMGLDPVGLGFVSVVQRDSENKITSFQDNIIAKSAKDDIQGKGFSIADVIASWGTTNPNMSLPTNAPIANYILSNEKTFLPYNYFISYDAGNKSETDPTLTNELTVEAFITLYAANCVTQGPIVALVNTFGQADAINNQPMTGGLLCFHTEDEYKQLIGESSQKSIGEAFKDFIDEKTTELKINRSERTMEIDSSSLDLSQLSILTNKFKYDLDAWVGRYGKPFEFLTSLHLATMSSGLTSELMSNKDEQTQVHIVTQSGDYDLDFEVAITDENNNVKQVPITFGKPYDNLYVGDINLKKNDEGKFEIDYSEDIEKIKAQDGGITISKLHNLMQTVDEKFGGEYYDYMCKAIKTFLNGSDGYKGLYQIKYDIETENVNNKYLGTFIDVKGGEILNNEGEGYYDSQEVPYSLRSLGYDDASVSFKMKMDAPEESDKTIKSAKALKIEGENNEGKVSYMQSRLDPNDPDNSFDGDLLAITMMLIQIDQFLDQYLEEDFTEMNVDELINGGYGKLNILNNNFKYDVYDATWGSGDLYLNYSWKWMNNLGNKKVLNEIYNDLKEFSDTQLEKGSLKQQIIDKIWKDAELDGDPLTVDEINKIYGVLEAESQKKVRYVEPRILFVTHHWFKDLDFGQSYEQTDNVLYVPADYLQIPKNAENGDNRQYDFTAILSNHEHYIQKQQPYVIKGDVVTLDGVVQSNDVVGTGADFGKGYEASKKIFTQGQYYTYDGTEETSRGNYFNELIESTAPGTTLLVSVTERGNIFYVKKASETDESVPSEDVGENDVKAINSKFRVQYIGKNEGTSAGTLKKYLLTVRAPLTYVSPTEGLEESKQSVNDINEALKAMGVTSLRKPISFDGTTADGTMLTQTAFSILEGMKTTSAAYIYRDLKEFLVELGYFSKAEFDEIDSNVLTWFMPSYIPKGKQEWAENTDKDVIEYGAVLYQKGAPEINAKDTAEDEQKGFESEVEIIAPGNARAIEVGNIDGTQYITLEFDASEDSKLSSIDKYKMIITGLKLEVQANENKVIKRGTRIGTTGSSKIQVIMKDTNGANLSNVEEYMAPPKLEGIVGSVYDQILALSKTVESFAENVGRYVNSDTYNGIVSNYWNYIDRYSQLYGLDPYLVVSVIGQESGGRPDVGEAAAGLMQFEWSNLRGGTTYTVTFKDGTSESFKIDSRESFISNEDLQIHLGCALLKQKFEQYGSVLAVLQSYNYGDAGFRRCVSYYLYSQRGLGNGKGTYFGVSEDEFYSYLESGDIEWLTARQWYTNEGNRAFSKAGGGDPLYPEHVLRYYNLSQ